MKMSGRVTIMDLLTRILLFNAFGKLFENETSMKSTCFLLVAWVPIRVLLVNCSLRCVFIQQLTVWEGAVGKGLFQHGVGKLHRAFVVLIYRKWCKRSYLVLSLCHYVQ